MTAGVKYDGQKPRWSLLPTDLLWGAIEVLEHGARKYSPNNWMHVPNGVERYSDAAARHLGAIERGEANDPDSGLPHAYHYLCSAIFTAWKILNRPEELKAWQERGSVVIPVPAHPDAYCVPEAFDHAAHERALDAADGGPLDTRPGLPHLVQPAQHEHVFELCDSGTSQIRRWACSCKDSVTHEEGTHAYKRSWVSGRVPQVYNTYFAATRAR